MNVEISSVIEQRRISQGWRKSQGSGKLRNRGLQQLQRIHNGGNLTSQMQLLALPSLPKSTGSNFKENYVLHGNCSTKDRKHEF